MQIMFVLACLGSDCPRESQDDLNQPRDFEIVILLFDLAITSHVSLSQQSMRQLIFADCWAHFSCTRTLLSLSASAAVI